MKTVYKIIIVVVVAGIACLIYYFATFRVFEPEFTQIGKVPLKGRSDSLNIIYYHGNATVQSSIQIRKEGQKQALKFYERYNYVNSYNIDDSSLVLVLSDTSVAKSMSDILIIPLSELR